MDPASRALLDLSLRRDVRPEDIGELLGTDPESVILAREGALERLASELGMAGVSELDDVRVRLAELPGEAWTGVPVAEAEEPALAVVEEEPRKTRMPLLLAVLAVAAVVLVVVLASGGGDEKSTTNAGSRSAATPPKPAPAPAPAAPAHKVPLAAVGSAGGATGTAAFTEGGKRLRIDVSGLPDPHDGAYQVWLYDSVIDAVSLVQARGTKLTLDLKLPRTASHYRYVDISLEAADGNPNHSGESVLRVPLAKLSR
jgi:hypothetical protein